MDGQKEFIERGWKMLIPTVARNINFKIKTRDTKFTSCTIIYLKIQSSPVSPYPCPFLYFQDEYLDRFLSLTHAAEEHRIPPRIGEVNFEGELKRSITDLQLAKSGPLIRFVPLILDKLLELMVRPPVIAGQVCK